MKKEVEELDDSNIPLCNKDGCEIVELFLERGKDELTKEELYESITNRIKIMHNLEDKIKNLKNNTYSILKEEIEILRNLNYQDIDKISKLRTNG